GCPGQVRMEGDGGAKQAVARPPRGLELDTQEPRKEEARPPRLDSDARGDSPVLEVPAVIVNQMLGNNTARSKREWLPLNSHNPIDKLKWTVRQADASWERVNLGEPRTQDVAHLPAGELHASVEIEGPRNIVPPWDRGHPAR